MGVTGEIAYSPVFISSTGGNFDPPSDIEEKLMEKSKYIVAVAAITGLVWLPSAAMSQSLAGIYGKPPCGFIEVKHPKKSGPVWQINFVEWGSAKCVTERKKYEIKPDTEIKKLRQQVDDQGKITEQARGRMEAALSIAETAHADVTDGLREANRLFQLELGRSTGSKNWTAYKTQLAIVEELNGNYKQNSGDYVTARDAYETQLTSLKVLMEAQQCVTVICPDQPRASLS